MLMLVVEDDALIRMLVCDLLEEAGFDCVAAADAVEALTLLESGCRPGMLLTDFNLGPGPDGMALARAVARRFPGLPTVFVTGNPECFADYPMAAWERLVAKPFTCAELLAAIGALQAAGHRPAGAESEPDAADPLLAMLYELGFGPLALPEPIPPVQALPQPPGTGKAVLP